MRIEGEGWRREGREGRERASFRRPGESDIKRGPVKDRTYILAITLVGKIFISRPTIFQGNTGTVDDFTFFSIRRAMMAAAFSGEMRNGLLLSILLSGVSI